MSCLHNTHAIVLPATPVQNFFFRNLAWIGGRETSSSPYVYKYSGGAATVAPGVVLDLRDLEVSDVNDYFIHVLALKR